MKSDEDKVYMKIVELEEIYDFVIHQFLFKQYFNNLNVF
ncbi:hypothetical protein Zm00014a_023870 [Zea mays]|uniref:Uncharacterized protein n=2 Tax=Zea mays TaxID=4577 RepID=A0A3L6E067_MAIZE|nr:hypothetical protein Zm00014a_023870 [Zea mays]